MRTGRLLPSGQAIVLAVLLVGVGCEARAVGEAPGRPKEPPPAANQPPSKMEPKTEPPTTAAADLPDDVLVGTDVVKLATLLASPAKVSVPGSYRCEQGGASASVQLETSPRGLKLVRRFQEPGSKAARKEYAGLRVSDDGKSLSGSEIEVRGVKEGILVLERRSDVDGIPASLWILYQPSRARQR